MSILNVLVTPDVAHIGVDTCGVLDDGSMVEGCKTLCLPHLNAVLGFRGSSRLLMMGASQLIGVVRPDFDALAQQIPELLKDVVESCRQHLLSSGEKEDSLHAFEFVLVGWSTKLQRMQGHLYCRSSGVQDIQHHSGFGFYVSPHLPGRFPDGDAMRSARDLEALALEQFHIVVSDAEWGDLPAGGRFYVTDVQKNRISTRMAFNFPPR